ncbi:MAG: hypothetical protein ABIL40_11850, partial [candidate division WOR-3 bacterium]
MSKGGKMSRVNIIILLFCLGFATTYIADTPGEIQSYTNQLQAGDTLLIMPGTYDMNWNISDRY